MDGDLPQDPRVQQALAALLKDATPIERVGGPSIVINGDVTINVVIRAPRRR